MARAIAIAVGALILTAAAHVTIQATGGYGTAHSWLTIAVAGGVGVAAVFSGRAWSEDRATIAILLFIAIVAGEAYGLVATAERLIAGREETQAPLRKIAEDRAQAQRRLDDTIKARAALPVSSNRLENALAEKRTTDAAVVSKSAERGCVENCRKLLQAQADAAELEVTRAREEIADKARDADQAIADAKRDLQNMRAPTSAAPLADRLGLSACVLDLIVAALGSIAANGLACFLIVYGAHRPGPVIQANKEGDAARQEIPDRKAAALRRATRRRPAELAESEPIRQAKAFAVARLMPTATATTDIKAILRAYRPWCAAAGLEPQSMSDLAAAFSSLFEVERQGNQFLLQGVALKKAEPSGSLRPT